MYQRSNAGYGLLSTFIAITISAISISLAVQMASTTDVDAKANTAAADFRYMADKIRNEFKGDYTLLDQTIPGAHQWFPAHYQSTYGAGSVIRNPSTGVHMGVRRWADASTGITPILPGMTGNEGFVIQAWKVPGDLCFRLLPLVTNDFQEIWVGAHQVKSHGAPLEPSEAVRRQRCDAAGAVYVSSY